MKIYNLDQNQTNPLVEMEILKQADSRYVVELLQANQIGDSSIALIMPEYPSTLSDFVRYGYSTKLSDEEFLQILVDAAQGILYVHSLNYLHRDIKSGNILITKHKRAKVADFGLAKYNDKETGTVVDRANYCAPEFELDKQKHDAKMDVWSFGFMIYSAVEGLGVANNYPYSINNYTDLKFRRDLWKSGFCTFLRKLVCKTILYLPNDRYFPRCLGINLLSASHNTNVQVRLP